VTAYPYGTRDSQGNHFWNATDACCDFDGTGINDVAYLDGVISAIQAAVAIDPRRIYLIGHSNGGFMSFAFACAHADRIAAIVSLAGATFDSAADCRPTKPVAVLAIHGTADDTVPFKGGKIEGIGSKPMTAFPGAEKTVATWAKYDGCAGTAALVDRRIDLDADVDDAGNPAEATVQRWSACKPGGGVELWTMRRGSHVPNISNAFPAAVLNFLEAHPKP
jgi:polyhydroxybutyrate depolymerase